MKMTYQLGFWLVVGFNVAILVNIKFHEFTNNFGNWYLQYLHFLKLYNYYAMGE